MRSAAWEASRRPANQAVGVWLLAAGQTLAWAGVYYLFAALLLRWERDLGWSKEEVAGAFTVAILASAAAAPAAGAIVDRGHGRPLLALSALSAATLLAMLSLVDHIAAFYAIWALLGVAMAGCLYEPCFAYVTRLAGDGARDAITRITLVAGFASTLCFPLASTIAEAAGWRTSTLVFAGLAFAAAALFWVGGGLLERSADDAAAVGDAAARRRDRAADRTAVAAALRKPIFWLLALAFATMALNHGVLIAHLFGLLDARGVSPAYAVFAASLIGPMQVAGRVLMMTVGARLSSLRLTMISFATVALGAVVLLVAGGSPTLIVVFALCQGAGYGLTSILRPVVAAELLGRQGFGAISGRLALPYLVASALAPAIGAVLWRLAAEASQGAASAGADAAILFALVAAIAGFAAFAVAASEARRAERGAASSFRPASAPASVDR